jgi:uncharacterized LabA/DUF88 family protein
MASQLEVGLFIDFENIRYGLLNHYGHEPDPQALMEKARTYGPVAVAYAYADFTQQPALYRRKLEVAGISPRDVPRRSPDVPHKSSADMAMLMDIIDCLLDRPSVNTLVLMTGDSDFIRVTARARHRFGKQVVIAGVPGSVSSDLVESADIYDPVGDDLEPLERHVQDPDEDQERLMQLVLWLDAHRPYMTFGFIRSHALSPHHGLSMTEDRVTDLLAGFKEQSILIESFRPSDDGRTLRTLELSADHELVRYCSQGGIPTFEEGPRIGRRSAGSTEGMTAEGMTAEGTTAAPAEGTGLNGHSGKGDPAVASGVGDEVGDEVRGAEAVEERPDYPGIAPATSLDEGAPTLRPGQEPMDL